MLGNLSTTLLLLKAEKICFGTPGGIRTHIKTCVLSAAHMPILLQGYIICTNSCITHPHDVDIFVLADSEWRDSNSRLRAPKARRLAAGLHPDKNG